MAWYGQTSRECDCVSWWGAGTHAASLSSFLSFSHPFFSCLFVFPLYEVSISHFGRHSDYPVNYSQLEWAPFATEYVYWSFGGVFRFEAFEKGSSMLFRNLGKLVSRRRMEQFSSIAAHSHCRVNLEITLWPRFFVVSLSFLTEMPRDCLKLGHDQFLP